MSDPLARLAAALADRYRLERELGAGGMATVYLAQDLRHDRKVAIKVLRPELAAVIGAERFLSEIKTTANLQHPHILPLFDSGAADGFLFYVMPFIEGESLRDRLVREQQLPVSDAIRVASEIASALDYAHRHNVIHRDIKPENILLHDGRALVADFGIALAASKAGGTRMTETGMSLGTPTYMSPEQAMGEREITARSDVYALGCVTYEMLIGEPPFTGPTAQAIIARVMTEDPRSLTGQRKSIPPHVEAAVATALSKLPADRFGSAAEFAEALAHPTATTAHAMAGASGGKPMGLVQRVAPWLVAAGAVAVAAWGWLGRAPRPAVQRQYIGFNDTPVPDGNNPSLALAPDGQGLVIREAGAAGRLWLKRAGELDATPLPGTEGANFPTVSPDGQWVAFVQNGQLRKTRLGEGGVITLADSALQYFGGAAWMDDGSIIYVGPSLDQLSRVSSAGSTPTSVLKASALTGMGLAIPQGLPGGLGVLFTACTSGCATVSTHVLDLKSGEERQLLDGVTGAWYLPTGKLLYLRRDGVALVAPFDLQSLQLTGEAVPVLQRVRIVGLPFLTVAHNGTLVYMQGEATSTDREAVRVTRGGAATPIDTAWHGEISSAVVAPEGRRLAVGVGLATGTQGIWIKTLDRGPFTRLTFGGGDRRPAWSPDGRTVAFVRDSGGSSSVYAVSANGGSPPWLLTRLDRQVQEVAWSPDGRWLVLRTDNVAAGAGDLVGVRTSGDTTPVPLVASRFTELMPAVSPDGRWLAYVSDESGTPEVYVRPFPGTDGGRWQVSTGGADSPVWSRDGRELFFVNNEPRLVSAHLRTQPGFEVTEREPLFDLQAYTLPGFHQPFDVLPGGGFLFIRGRSTGQAQGARAVVRVDHWFDALPSGGGR